MMGEGSSERSLSSPRCRQSSGLRHGSSQAGQSLMVTGNSWVLKVEGLP